MLNLQKIVAFLAFSALIFNYQTAFSSAQYLEDQSGPAEDLSAWNAKAKITIPASELRISSPLYGFPVLFVRDNFPVEMFNPNAVYHAKGDACDIRFTADEAGQSQLPFSVVKFAPGENSLTAEIQIWVKPYEISSQTDTEFYVWYANDSATCIDPTNYYSGANSVWNDGYQFVYHMEDDPTATAPQLHSDRNTGVDAGFKAILSPETSVSGKIGNAFRLDEATNGARIYNPDNFYSTYGYFSIWVAPAMMEKPNYSLFSMDTQVFEGRPDLLGLWHMNSDFSDSSIYNHQVESPLATIVPEARLGAGSASFGVESRIYLASTTDFQKYQFTIAAWVKPNSMGTIFSNIDGMGNGYDLAIDETGRAVFNVYSGWNPYGVIGPTLPVDKWSHITVTYDPANIKFYINGLPGPEATSSMLYYMPGYDVYPSIGSGYSGLIDELAIFNRALNAQEVSNIYIGEFNLRRSGPMLIFNVGNAHVETDISGWQAGDWHQIGASFGSTLGLYIDGELMSSSEGILASISTDYAFLGGDGTGDFAWTFPGLVDEARLSIDSKSADWVHTEYRNQSAPASFSIASAPTHSGLLDVTNYNEDHHNTTEVQPGAVAPMALSAQTSVPLLTIDPLLEEELTPEELEKLKFNFTIDNGAAKATSRQVKLKFFNISSVVVNMAISEDPGFKYASMEPFAETKNLTLSEGYGMKTVYVKFYNSFGISSDPVMQTIEYAKAITGDINNDGSVDLLDFNILMNDWGKKGGPADLKKDGSVDLFDLNILMGNWK